MQFIQLNTLRLILIRFSGVVISALTHFISIRVFIKEFPEISTEMVSIYNWLTVIPVIQFGFGRPIYTKLRGQFHKDNSSRNPLNNLSNKILNSSRRLLNCLALLAITTYVVLSANVLWRKLPIEKLFPILIFAIGIGVQSIGQYQRDVAYAISKEITYESLELARRSVMLFGLILLSFSADIALVGLMQLVFGLLIYAMCDRALYKTRCKSFDDSFFSEILKDAGKCFIFSVAEYLIYNAAFLFCVIKNSRDDLIYTVVWNRIYQIVVLPMRMIIDSRLNEQTSLFFKKKNWELKRQLKISATMGGVCVCGALIFLYCSGYSISKWLMLKKEDLNGVTFVSLFLWSGANVIQHTYASFLMSQHYGFNLGLKLSVTFLFLIWIAMVGSFQALNSINTSLVVSGCIMLLMSFYYIKKCNVVINSNYSKV